MLNSKILLINYSDGSLINLSNNPRHGSSEKIYNTVESLNNTSHGYSFNYSRRHSQNLLKSSQEKYHNSAVYPQNWSSISSCLSTNTGSINTVVPFVFNGGQSSHSEISTKVNIRTFLIFINYVFVIIIKLRITI